MACLLGTSRSSVPTVLLTALLLAGAVACSDGDLGADAGRDASPADAGPRDGAPFDAGTGIDAATDAPPADADPGDAGGDAAGEDAGTSGSDPSGGSGGAFPGAQTRTATTEGGASFDYHLYIPSAYDPASPIPLLSVFHGQGDTGSNMRDFWQSTAESEGFVILATSSTGSSGGWDPGTDVPRYSAALDDALAAYNVEQNRIYVWGFSAGAHLVHGIALANTDTFAAYSVSAGALRAFAGTDGPMRADRIIPVDIHIGTDDPLFDAAQMDRDRFVAAGWTEGDTLSYVTFAGGHTVRPAHLGEIWAFLSGWTL